MLAIFMNKFNNIKVHKICITKITLKLLKSQSVIVFVKIYEVL